MQQVQQVSRRSREPRVPKLLQLPQDEVSVAVPVAVPADVVKQDAAVKEELAGDETGATKKGKKERAGKGKEGGKKGGRRGGGEGGGGNSLKTYFKRRAKISPHQSCQPSLDHFTNVK